jgi:type IV pilus assembly protein PilV
MNISCRKTQAGVTLIEVMVSILVLSIGALGLAGLQISAKRAGYEAVQRTDASFLAMDIMERMRANPSVLVSYATPGVGEASGTALGEPGACTAEGMACLPAGIKLRDMWDWEQALNGASATSTAGKNTGGLLNPIGCISFDGRIVTVQIAWEGFETLSDPGVSGDCGFGVYDTGKWQLLEMRTYIGTP